MQDFRMETFLTVCRKMSYTKAAKELHITQPAVSQHIRYLEKYYSTKLFYYEGKKLELSEAGKILKNAATTMQHDEILLKSELSVQKKEKLIFGATRTIGDYVIPQKISEWMKENSEPEVRMLVDNTETLLKKIDSGDLDFAFIEGYFRKTEYEYKEISNEEYIAVKGKNCSTKKDTYKLNELFNKVLVLREKGSGTREILERYLKERNFSIEDFTQVVEIGSIQAIKSILSKGEGISFLYKAAVMKELRLGEIEEINITDFNMCNCFNMVWRKNSLFADRYKKIYFDMFERTAKE